jgi:hypothetical protein
MGKLNTGSVNNAEFSKDVSLANPHLDKMTTDGSYLQGWTGDAAMAFKANFIDTFKTVSGNQFTMLPTLKGALQAQSDVAQGNDIDKIAENTKNALDNARGCGKNQWSFGFSTLSAVMRSVAWVLPSRLGALCRLWRSERQLRWAPQVCPVLRHPGTRSHQAHSGGRDAGNCAESAGADRRRAR